jgi:hypothetical protein
MNGRGRVGIFPDLASQRTKSVEMMNQLVGTRQKFAGKIRAIIGPVLTPEESKELDRIAIERDGVERQLSVMPTTDEGVLAHERAMKERFAEIDRQASELNVEIQAMEAQLIAIENYYRVSRSEQKIRPEDIRQPVRCAGFMRSFARRSPTPAATPPPPVESAMSSARRRRS